MCIVWSTLINFYMYMYVIHCFVFGGTCCTCICMLYTVSCLEVHVVHVFVCYTLFLVWRYMLYMYLYVIHCFLFGGTCICRIGSMVLIQ